MQLDYGPPRDERETLVFSDFMRRCFDLPQDKLSTWLATMGAGNLRLLRRGGRVVAGLGRIEMGQHFGGVAIPMTGVGGVAVPPEERGGGLARELMAHLLRELAAEGRPLSTLYPATFKLYRGAGYELAGGRYLVALDARAVDLAERALPVRPIEDADRAAVEACYERSARWRPGYLARGDYCWKRVRAPRGEATDGYLVERDRVVVGYVHFLRRDAGDVAHDLQITDLVAEDAHAGRRLLTLLADHRSVVRELRWHEGPNGPLLALLPERGARISLYFPWMLRIVDARAALAQRGFSDELRGELTLELRDAVLPQNAGLHTLRVADGRGALEPGGKRADALALDERGLAALFSGFMSAEALRAAGRLDGPPAVLRRASALFAGPAPGMSDMF